MRTLFTSGLLTAVVATLLLGPGGCGRSQPTRFYLLASLQYTGKATRGSRVDGAANIGVAEVTIPAYLDRSQLVTRTEQNRLAVADFDLWAGALQEQITRVLAENLSGILASQRVFPYPWPAASMVKYQVVVNIVRFEGSSEGKVSLKAHWAVLDESDKVIVTRDSNITEQADGTDYTSVVGAQSRALAKLSREIAAAFKTIGQ